MRYDYEFRNRPTRYDRSYTPPPGSRSMRPRRDDIRYGADDYWWIGERAMPPRRRQPYDEMYDRFSRSTRPRYSPVGGMYGPMGGDYLRRAPREVREPTRFSDWTRWF